MTNFQGLPWQENLQPQLVKRLTRPLHQPGMMRADMAGQIFQRTDRFLNRLPLLAQQTERWGRQSLFDTSEMPIVYAQPAPPADTAEPTMPTAKPTMPAVTTLPVATLPVASPKQVFRCQNTRPDSALTTVTEVPALPRAIGKVSAVATSSQQIIQRRADPHSSAQSGFPQIINAASERHLDVGDLEESMAGVSVESVPSAMLSNIPDLPIVRPTQRSPVVQPQPIPMTAAVPEAVSEAVAEHRSRAAHDSTTEGNTTSTHTTSTKGGAGQTIIQRRVDPHSAAKADSVAKSDSVARAADFPKTIDSVSAHNVNAIASYEALEPFSFPSVSADARLMGQPNLLREHSFPESFQRQTSLSQTHNSLGDSENLHPPESSFSPDLATSPDISIGSIASVEQFNIPDLPIVRPTQRFPLIQQPTPIPEAVPEAAPGNRSKAAHDSTTESNTTSTHTTSTKGGAGQTIIQRRVDPHSAAKADSVARADFPKTIDSVSARNVNAIASYEALAKPSSLHNVSIGIEPEPIVSAGVDPIAHPQAFGDASLPESSFFSDSAASSGLSVESVSSAALADIPDLPIVRPTQRSPLIQPQPTPMPEAALGSVLEAAPENRSTAAHNIATEPNTVGARTTSTKGSTSQTMSSTTSARAASAWVGANDGSIVSLRQPSDLAHTVQQTALPRYELAGTFSLLQFPKPSSINIQPSSNRATAVSPKQKRQAKQKRQKRQAKQKNAVFESGRRPAAEASQLTKRLMTSETSPTQTVFPVVSPQQYQSSPAYASAAANHLRSRQQRPVVGPAKVQQGQATPARSTMVFAQLNRSTASPAENIPAENIPAQMSVARESASSHSPPINANPDVTAASQTQPNIDIDQLSHQVERRIMRRLVIESERRGRKTWF